MNDEKIIDDVVKNTIESHPSKKEEKGIYYDFQNTLSDQQKYNDPIKQREQ